MSTEIEVTKAAALKVKELIVEEGNSNLMLRVVVVVSGTSSDSKYRFTFDEVVHDGDTEVVKEDVRFLVDPMSFQYLAESEIDYTEGLEGSRFVIRNPNDDEPPPAVSNAMRHG